jgi:glycosyltransferase involved in cell wall biosynthesis
MTLLTYDVVIPCYNSGKYLAESVNSALNQSYPPSNIFIVNDGSNDSQTLEALAAISKMHKSITVLDEPHRGVSHARNVGLRNCKSKYVAFLDADDIWIETKMQVQLDALMSTNTDVNFVDFVEIDDSGLIRSQNPHSNPESLSLISLLTFKSKIWGSASSVVASRNVIESVGGFNELMSHAEDFDYWVRIQKKFAVHYIAKQLLKIRITHSSSSRSNYCKSDPFANIRGICTVLEENWIFVENEISKGLLVQLIWSGIRDSLFQNFFASKRFFKSMDTLFPRLTFFVFSGLQSPVSRFFYIVRKQISARIIRKV